MALGSSFFFTGAFARSFSLLQGKAGTPGGGRTGKGGQRRRGLDQDPLPPLPSRTRGRPAPWGRPAPRGRLQGPAWARARARAQPQPHSHALVPEADHALHDRVLPRLLLLPLQAEGHTAAMSWGETTAPHSTAPPTRARLTIPPLPPLPPLLLLPVPPRRVTASRLAEKVREWRHFRPPALGSGSLRRSRVGAGPTPRPPPEPSVTALPAPSRASGGGGWEGTGGEGGLQRGERGSRGEGAATQSPRHARASRRGGGPAGGGGGRGAGGPAAGPERPCWGPPRRCPWQARSYRGGGPRSAGGGGGRERRSR